MIGINARTSFFNNTPFLDKDLTVTLSDFKFLNNKKEVSNFEQIFNKNENKIKTETGLELTENKDCFIQNISFHRRAERPYAPEENQLFGTDIVGVGAITGEPIINILTKLTLNGNYGSKCEYKELTKAGFEKYGVAGPISDEQMIKYSENIKSWLVNGGSPGREITEDDLYNIAVDGKLDDLASLSMENLALQSIREQSAKSYESMSKMIDEIIEDEKKANCIG